jgi:hypothetical protein
MGLMIARVTADLWVLQLATHPYVLAIGPMIARVTADLWVLQLATHPYVLVL